MKLQKFRIGWNVLDIQVFIERKYKPTGFIEHETMKTAMLCFIGLDDARQEENLLGTFNCIKPVFKYISN